jgi:hypothetical protein
MTTGCRRTKPSSCRISASSVLSFFFALRTEVGQRVTPRSRQRQQIGEECDILVGRCGEGQQSLELLPPGGGRVVAREPRCPAELVDKRKQRAVLVMGRAEIAQAEMRLGVEALLQCRRDARLAEAGFAGDHHDLAVTSLSARPAAQQQIDFLVAADQRRQRRSPQCLEPALDGARPQYPPRRHRRGNALHFDGAEIAVLEEITDQPPCAGGDDDRARLGQGLQPGGEVGRLADDRLLLRRSLADQIADDHQPGGDADARLQLDGFDIEANDGLDQTEPCSDRAFGIVLMRPRVPEINEHAVAHIFGDEAVEASDDTGDRAMIGADDLAQILGIEPRRQRGRADEIAEHHRELPAFGFTPRCECCGRCGRQPWRIGYGRGSAQGGDGIEQLAPVADRCDANLPEVIRCQLRQHLPIDLVIAEGRHIALKAQTLQPRLYVHAVFLSSAETQLHLF